MKLRLISVLTLIICNHAFSGKLFDSEPVRRLLESSYQELKTEDSFVTYVTFLITKGGREGKPSWMNEAEHLINKYKWVSDEQRLRVSRNLCLKRADLMTVEKRYNYLFKANQQYPVDYRDSLTVLLEVTTEQHSNFLEGKKTPAAIFTRATSAYIEADTENKLGYMEVMLQHGRSVYYVDEIFLMKTKVLIEGLEGMQLQDSEMMRYLSIKVKLSSLSGESDDALNFLTKLKAMETSEGYDRVIRELCRWILYEHKTGTLSIEVPLSNVADYIEQIIQDTKKKGRSTTSKGVSPEGKGSRINR